MYTNVSICKEKWNFYPVKWGDGQGISLAIERIRLYMYN